MVIASNQQEAKDDLFPGMLYLTLQAVVFAVLLPLLAMFLFGQVSETNVKFFSFYGILLIVGIGVLALLKFAQSSSFTNLGNRYPLLKSFGALNHDPENGLIGLFSPKIAKMLFGNQVLLFLGSFILLGGYIFFSANPIQVSQTFIGQSAIPAIPEEVAVGIGKTILEIFPAAEAETIFVVAIASFFASLVVAFVPNLNTKSKQLIGLAILSFSILIIGLSLHTARYGGSDIATSAVFRFWLIGGVLTAISGSMIPFRVLHWVNNLIVATAAYLSSDIALTIIQAIVLSAVGVLVIIILNKSKSPSPLGVGS